MKSFKRRALALVAAGAVTASAILPAQAGPSQVAMDAGGCPGFGNSVLTFPTGYANTTGCSNSARYLSASASYSGGGGASTPGNWYGSNVLWPVSAPSGWVTAIAATHNLGYQAATNGWAGTNTW